MKNIHFMQLFVKNGCSVITLLVLTLLLVSTNGQAQQTIRVSVSSDSLHNLLKKVEELQRINHQISAENESLRTQTLNLISEKQVQENRQATLSKLTDSLRSMAREQTRQLAEKENLLQQQARLQKEKEELFAEKEQRYKDALATTTIDKTRLEGRISSVDARLEGKNREIDLLQKNIDEKNAEMHARTLEIQTVVAEKKLTEAKADSMRTTLNATEKKLLLTSEQLKFNEIRLKDCENRYASVTNKKKKTRVVQGFALKNYRTPDFALAPKDAQNPSVYVISNKNSSSVEFDFVTGASIMLKDLSKEGGSMTYDVGFFLGFGGNNLFKNFYLGPNIKLFDVLHVNTGVNIAEYEALKEGFNVGDVLSPGISIPTTKEWRVNAYVGITFDLDLITMIGKK